MYQQSKRDYIYHLIKKKECSSSNSPKVHNAYIERKNRLPQDMLFSCHLIGSFALNIEEKLFPIALCFSFLHN